MEFKENEKIVIAKPVASRPTISNFRSFSELFSDDSPSSEPTVTAIRPKTARFRPAMSSSPVDMLSSQAELAGTQAFRSSHKISKSNHTSHVLYKPLAKTVSRTTLSLLANMGTFNDSHEQAPSQNLASQLESVKSINAQQSTMIKSGNDKRFQLPTNNNDRPSYDGYNWRKYGQKQVKGSEYPRSYYKCTHPNCLVKKKVERSINGEIAEIVYKGDHNHPKPRLPRHHVFDGTNDDLNHQVLGSSSNLTNFVKVQESCNEHVLSEEFDASMPTLDYNDHGKAMMEIGDDDPSGRKRKSLCQVNETDTEGLQEPRIIVHDGTDSEAISDGFRWRKYGQKVVKGNPYPRSYYRCTGVKCNVRKHVERASDDPSVFITTYEGKHNHEMPMKKPN